MSKHIWLHKRFQVWTLIEAQNLLNTFIKDGMDFDTAVGLLGYVMEATRQTGKRVEVQILCGAIKSNHRYAKGKNGVNYIRAGRMLMNAIGERLGLEDAPAEVVWDAMQQRCA